MVIVEKQAAVWKQLLILLYHIFSGAFDNTCILWKCWIFLNNFKCFEFLNIFFNFENLWKVWIFGWIWNFLNFLPCFIHFIIYLNRRVYRVGVR
jgi:hypothetical protein